MEQPEQPTDLKPLSKAALDTTRQTFEYVKDAVERKVTVARAIELREMADNQLEGVAKEFAKANGLDFYSAYDALTAPGEPGRPLLEASIGLSEIIADNQHPMRA